MIFGYLRVADRRQDLHHVRRLEEIGAAKVYLENLAQGAGRPQLRKVLTVLDPGDVLVVTQLDRIAHSIEDLVSILDEVRRGGASFRSLQEPWADTEEPRGEFMLTVLRGAASLQNSMAKLRIVEGRLRAKESGRDFGRPPKLSPSQQESALAMLKEGSGVRETARLFGVSPPTISRLRRRNVA